MKKTKKLVKKKIAEEGGLRDEEAVKRVRSSPELVNKVFIDATKTLTVRQTLKRVCEEVEIPPKKRRSISDGRRREKEEADFERLEAFFQAENESSNRGEKKVRRGRRRSSRRTEKSSEHNFSLSSEGSTPSSSASGRITQKTKLKRSNRKHHRTRLNFVKNNRDR